MLELAKLYSRGGLWGDRAATESRNGVFCRQTDTTGTCPSDRASYPKWAPENRGSITRERGLKLEYVHTLKVW